VREADLILVLKDGRLVEQGTYEELISLGGLFAELNAQGTFIADDEAEPHYS
jgi:ABC-type multidrug transport system fused ATPase/permease subunit